MPKEFYKLSIEEQEKILIQKKEKIHKEEDAVRKMLGTIRGGNKILEPTDIDAKDNFKTK